MEPGINTLVVHLTSAVVAVMNPATPPQQRMEASRVCEDFKENSPQCAICGLLMAAKDNDHIIRHFGLQLLEHCVRYRWYKMNPEEKLFIKENTMKLLKEGTLSLLVEQAHIKDAVSRIVVEMIKREWPQQWQSLMAELTTLCGEGPTQIELVMLVFLRLAEDVLLFQSVQQQRRREIMHGLTDNMPNLFKYFVTSLEENYNLYMKNKDPAVEGAPTQNEIGGRLVQGVLNTLAAFLDWVSMDFVVDKSGRLLELLCLMLSETPLQLAAAECLLVITNRKGKLEERKPLLILFSDAGMNTILNAAIIASKADLTEHHYVFLKKMCQVLIAIGNQLAGMWGSCDDVQEPPNFHQYLKAILAFTSHPSQTLGSYTQTLWASFLRHEHISKNAVFQSFIPGLIETTRQSLLKVGFPTQENSPSCVYSKLDFDSDEDFNLFFSKYRAEVAETIRHCTLVWPAGTFRFAAQWLTQQLRKPLDIGGAANHCNLSSPAFLEWDGLTLGLESVMSRLMNANNAEPPVTDGIQLLKDVLAFDTQDPLILSALLSLLSAFCPFLMYDPDLLPVVLDKIFSAAVFNLQGQTKSTRSKAVKNVRRHACSCLVKICKQYPDLLKPGFERLASHIKQLSSDPEELSQMEKCTLMEAIILVSNRFMDFDKQSRFIDELLAPVKEIWLSQQMKDSLCLADKFLNYVGLDQAPVEPSSEDTCGINRSHILHCVNTILAVLKRSMWPEDLEAAKAGGFVLGTSDLGVPIIRNPVTPYILSMFDNVLLLTRTLNILWSPEYLSKRHPAFQDSYSMLEVDRQVILGIHPPCVDNTDSMSHKHPLQRMQLFLYTIHNLCHHILGNAGSCLSHEFYKAPNLAQSLLNSFFANLEAVPNYRLRPIIRVFLKPYIQCCPKEYYATAVIPLLRVFCPFMTQRLISDWNQISERLSQKVETDEDDPESQEVLEEQLCRQLSREYIEFVGSLMRERRPCALTDDMDDGEMAGEVKPQPSPKDEHLGELGQMVLTDSNVYPGILMTLFTALGWPDTPACTKSVAIAWPVVKQLTLNDVLTSDDVAHLLRGLLLGLQQHGQHDNIEPVLLAVTHHFYENLRPKFPDLTKVMLSIPSCTEEQLKTFDERLMTPQKQLSDKKRKENFKKLIQDAIGRNVNEQFGRANRIKNLPPLLRPHRQKRLSLQEMENADIGLCSLFEPDDVTG